MDLSNEQQQYINQILASDPGVQQAVAALQTGRFDRFTAGAAQGAVRAAAAQALRRQGIDLGDDYAVGSDGQLYQRSFMQKHGEQVIGGIGAGIVGGAVLGPSLGGGGGAGGGGGGSATAGTIAPLTSNTIAAPAMSTPFTGGATAAGGSSAAAASGSSLVGGMLRYGVPMAGQFLSSYYGGKEAEKQDQRGTAMQESALNPFRQQLAQADAMELLDKRQNSSYSPLRYSGGQTTGSGYSYQRSPDVTEGLGDLKQSVMSGQGAPTMTNPDNYGRTSALDLNALRRRRRAPGTTTLVDDFVPSYAG